MSVQNVDRAALSWLWHYQVVDLFVPGRSLQESLVSFIWAGAGFILILLLLVELVTQRDYLRSFFYNRRLAYGLALALSVYHLVRLYYFLSSNTFDDIIKASIWQ